MTDDREIMTQVAAAKLYGVTRACIHHHVKQGNLNVVLVGKKPMVYKDEVLRLKNRAKPRGIKRISMREEVEKSKKRSSNEFNGALQTVEARRSGDGGGNREVDSTDL